MKKRLLAMLLVAASVVTLVGCTPTETTEKGNTQESETETEKEEFVPVIVKRYEAENATLQGGLKVSTSKTGYGGTGYVEGFATEEDICVFNIEIAETNFYDLNFVSSSGGGYKENFVVVDGQQLGTISVESNRFTDSILKRVYLEAGTHEVKVTISWGWILLDKLEILTTEPISESMYKVSAKLCNENATEETKRLMSYLADNYGTNILSGQNCDTGQFGKEFAIIKKETGKFPAVLGLDFIEYSPSRVENGSSSNATQLAINFWENGGIVTFCWHWNAPSKYLTGQWYSGFYDEYTNINLAKIMNGEDQEGYDLLMEDIDAIAQQLLILQEAKVPILWRPLHEASGGWFWWGANGAEAYKQLYILLYEKLTNEYKINNLIWLWNGQDAEWYPGDEYVDIIGEDIYPGEKVYTSQVNKYLEAVDYTSAKKMVVLSENGCLFDPDLAIRDGAMWGFWCTWGGEFVAKNTAIHSYSEQYTELEQLKKVYEHENVITLDELPDLKSYPIRDELK